MGVVGLPTVAQAQESTVSATASSIWQTNGKTWEELRFDVFFKGDDWRGTPKGVELERRFAEFGVEVVYFPYTVHTSSTALRRALKLLEDGVAREQLG